MGEFSSFKSFCVNIEKKPAPVANYSLSPLSPNCNNWGTVYRDASQGSFRASVNQSTGGGFMILEWEHWGHNIKRGTHTGHILIITVDAYVGLTFN